MYGLQRFVHISRQVMVPWVYHTKPKIHEQTIIDHISHTYPIHDIYYRYFTHCRKNQSRRHGHALPHAHAAHSFLLIFLPMPFRLRVLSSSRARNSLCTPSCSLRSLFFGPPYFWHSQLGCVPFFPHRLHRFWVFWPHTWPILILYILTLHTHIMYFYYYVHYTLYLIDLTYTLTIRMGSSKTQNAETSNQRLQPGSLYSCVLSTCTILIVNIYTTYCAYCLTFAVR